jgi:hypothetical protein
MGYYKPVDFVNGAKAPTRAQIDQIIGGNATRILGFRMKNR